MLHHVIPHSPHVIKNCNYEKVAQISTLKEAYTQFKSLTGYKSDLNGFI